MYHAAAVRQSRDQNPSANGVPLWTETACRFPPKPPAGLNRNRLSETPKFAVSAKHLFELPHQCRPLVEPRRVMRPPRPASTAEVAEVEAQKSEAFTSLRSTIRLFSSLISTCSLLNSSRSRLSTAPTSQSCRL